MAISPDGQWIAFSGLSDDRNRSGLYLRSANKLEPKLVANAPVAMFTPFFSPDSQWLGYWANGTIWKVQVTGGEPARICDVGGFQGPGPSWGDDGTIVFTKNGSLWRVSDRGGEAVVLSRPLAGERHGGAHVLPGSDAALTTISTGVGDSRTSVGVVSLKTGEIRKWMLGNTPRYVRPGLLVFRYLDALHAAPFDLSRLEVTGDPRPVLHDVNYYYLSGSSAFDVSHEGALIYTPGAPRAENSELVWLDREGRTEPAAPERQAYSNAELDAEGRRVAVHINSSLDDGDLSVYDIQARSWTRLTQGLETAGALVWSSDGQWILFSSKRSGVPKLFRIRTSGGTAEPLTDGPDLEYAQNIHGNAVMFVRQESARGGVVSLWRMTFDPPGTPERVPQMDLISGPGIPGKLSPDGQWIAYVVAREQQIFIRPFKGSKESQRHYIAASGWGPRWSRDGRSLFFRRHREIWVVPFRSGPGGNDFQAGTPKLLISHDSLISRFYGLVEPSSDGQRFLLVRTPERERKEPLLVYVPNWLDEVKEALKR